MDLPSIILINGRGPGTNNVYQIKFVTDNLVNCTIYKDQNKLKTNFTFTFYINIFLAWVVIITGFPSQVFDGGKGGMVPPVFTTLSNDYS